MRKVPSFEREINSDIEVTDARRDVYFIYIEVADKSKERKRVKLDATDTVANLYRVTTKLNLVNIF